MNDNLFLLYSPVIDRLQEAHVILLQEWNDNNGNFMEHFLHDYEILKKDRTAILYKRTFFEQNVEFIEVPLLHEEPSLLEKMYTTGRQKSNIFARLFYGTLPIYIGCFHLSAYSPSLHSGFHIKQMNDYLNQCINSDLFTSGRHFQDEISTNYNDDNFVESLGTKYGLIFGGDTNFNDGENHTNLFEIFINNEIRQKLKLKDVCSGNCNTIVTQDPKCMHEEDVGKTIARNVSKFKDYKSRLDLLMVNEIIITEETYIIQDCNLSDHSLISAKTRIELEEDATTSKLLTGGKKRRTRRKRRIRKRKTKKIKKGLINKLH